MKVTAMYSEMVGTLRVIYEEERAKGKLKGITFAEYYKSWQPKDT